MKKLFLTICVAFMSLVGANAQLTVGGSVGFSGTTGTSSKVGSLYTEDKQTEFGFSITPSVGYVFMNGKMEAGAALQYQLQTSNDYCPSSDYAKMQKEGSQAYNYLYVKPYVRYYCLQRNWFSLGIQGDVWLGGQIFSAPKVYVTDEQSKEQVDQENEQAKQLYKTLNPTSFIWRVGVVPVMKFDVNEHLAFDVKLDAVGLYLNGSTVSYKLEETKISNSTFNYGLNLLNNSTYASVGFAYKF